MSSSLPLNSRNCSNLEGSIPSNVTLSSMEPQQPALSAFEEKRYLLQDGIYSLAYLYKDILHRVTDIEHDA